MTEYTCAACGRTGTKKQYFKWTGTPHNDFVCRAGLACEKRCNQKGFSIYG